MIRLAAALLVLMLASCSGSAAKPVGKTTITISHYDLALDLTTRAASGQLAATATADGNCFDLADATEGLANVRVNGKTATVSRAPAPDQAVTICGDGFFAGDDVQIEYQTTVPAQTLSSSQVGFSATATGGGTLYYMLNWVAQCARLGPCDPTPNLFATYRFTVSHPATFTVLCPGDISTELTSTVCEFSHPGGPLYSTMGIIAYDRWETRNLGLWDGIAVTGYERAGGRVLDAFDADYFSNFLAWMTAEFGPYPYGDTLRLVVAPTYWSGFEHPGNIVLDSSLVSALGGEDDAIHTLLHELVHQWAGDQTTLAEVHDFVWKEAMAEYISYLYEDQSNGALAKKTRASWKAYSNGASYHPVPEEKPELFTYYGDVYGPGPMVLFRQVEFLSSRAQVMEALRALLGRPRALSVQEVIAALEASTGLDLQAYADAWIFGEGAPVWPRVALAGELEKAMYKISVEVVNAQAAPLGCKFHVQLQGAEPAMSLLVPVDLWNDGAPLSAWDTTIAAPAFEVQSMTLDPNQECLVYPSATAATPPRPADWSPWKTKHRYLR